MAEEIVWSARLGAHLEAFRQDAGLRRKDLALELEVSEETVRLWEKGAVQPSAERLARLIALLSLKASEWTPPNRPDAHLPPLALRLRHERGGRRLTQAEASLILEVPQATYAAWETGRTTPNPALYASLGAFLGTTEQEIRTLCDPAFVVDTTGWPPFGRFVGARRQSLRITRAELAGALGVAVGTVVAWELGYRVPGPKQIPHMADVLEVDVASLVATLPHPDAASSLGELITSRQRELGMHAAEVAARVGTTEATVSRWVHGRSRPARANLERLAAVLDLRLDDLAEAVGCAT